MSRLPSIARRLATALAAAAFAMFAASGAVFYGSIRTELVERADGVLKGRYALVAHLLEGWTPGAGDAVLRGALEDALLEADNMRLWVRDARGRVVFGGPWPEGVAPSGALKRVVDRDATPLDALAGRVPHPDGPVDVVVARDARPDQALLKELAERLIFECLVAAAVTAMLAWWIVRRGLRPLHRLGAQAESASLTRFGGRIDERQLPVELRPLAASLNTSLARMERAFRQMEEFNANVAHELRTPVGNVSGALQVALSRPRPEAEWRAVAQGALEDVERVSGIIRDMLFLARVDAGEWSRRLDDVELEVEARKVVDYFEAAAEDAGLALRVDGRARLVADAALVRRALSNLLSNALRHAEPGSTVDVVIEQADTHASLAVRNVGTMPSEHLARVFERFYRGESSRAAQAPGSGLGLAIVRAIAVLHGGETWAASAGGLTTIGLTLSATPRGAADGGAARPQRT